MSGQPPPPPYSAGSDPYKLHQQDHAPQPPRPEGYGNGYEKFTPRPKYNDVWAAVLFLIHLAGFVVLAVLAIPKVMQAIASGNSPGITLQKAVNGTVTNSTVQQTMGQNVAMAQGYWTSILVVVGITVVIGFLLSIVYLLLMQHFASVMIKVMLVASILLYVGMAVYLAVRGSVFGAAITGLFALLYAFAAYTWLDRIAFATIMLEAVVSVVRRYQGLVAVSIGGLLVQTVYTVLFAFTVAGVMLMYANDAKVVCKRRAIDGQQVCNFQLSGAAYGVYVFCLFSFYWTSQVIKNIVHVTVCGVFGAYYFLTNTPHMPTSPTLGALGRATTTSFGSVCFGSLIIAVIRTVRAILRMLQDQNDGVLAFIACCAGCILSCIESMLVYFNHYAYTQVAIYGKPFIQAGRDTWNMFLERGIEAIINDNLIGNVLGLGILTIGVLNAFIAYLLVVLVYPTIAANMALTVMVVLVAFLASIAFMMLVSQVIESGVATIYTALCEDPLALSRTNPALFNKIRESWPEVVMGMR